jgi:hypothetical protein
MVHSILATIAAIRSGFVIEPANASSSGNFFGLAQFLSTLALLVVVFNVSDFRFRYRLAVRRHNIRKIGIYISGFIAIALLLTELWFNNGLPIFHFLNNNGNVRLFLALIFVALILYIVCACYLWPARLRKSNAKQFFDTTTFFIHQGNKDRLQAVAEELNQSIRDTFLTISSIKNSHRGTPSEYQTIAHNLVLALADNRFCALIVDRVPAFALRCFELACQHPTVPFGNFSRNVGEEFIRNKNSAFYQEESGYQSGYFGYAKPITNTVFGNYSLVERCATQHACPLDLDFRTILNLDAGQADGLTRAGLAFLNSYLTETKGTTHSYAFARLLGSCKNCVSGLYKLDNNPGDYWWTGEYVRVEAVMKFIVGALDLFEEHNVKPRTKKPSSETYHDVYDALTMLIHDVILASSYVSTPPGLCWSVQHNLVWNQVFSLKNGAALKAIRYKVRRLLYNDIRFMERAPNFVGARILGFCLNVLGLSTKFPQSSIERSGDALRICAVRWVKANYMRLVENNPAVAEACIQGTITFDTAAKRLVKTYSNRTQKTPTTDFLELH